MKTRDELDAIAWATIHNRPQSTDEPDLGWRALDYAQIEDRLQAGVDFEHAWSDYLHAFYDYKGASFFAEPSPPSLSVQWRALLAGAAEWLSAEFGLPHPVWTDQPQYFLAEPWDPREDLGQDMAQFIGEVLTASPETFRKRNVAFCSRNLIAL